MSTPPVVGTHGVLPFHDMKEVSETIWIESISVPESLQNSGIGRRMMGRLFRIARRRGYTRIRLNSSVDVLSYRFFKKMGFHMYTKPDRNRVVGMEKQLRPARMQSKNYRLREKIEKYNY